MSDGKGKDEEVFFYALRCHGLRRVTKWQQGLYCVTYSRLIRFFFCFIRFIEFLISGIIHSCVILIDSWVIFYPDTMGLHHLSSIALLGGTNVMKCRFCLEVACVGFRKNRHHRLKVIQPHTLCSYTSITFEAILCLFYRSTTQNFIFKYCILKTIWKKKRQLLGSTTSAMGKILIPQWAPSPLYWIARGTDATWVCL